MAAAGLNDLDHVLRKAPDAWVLVLDPEANDGVAGLARELGATYAVSGFVPPPVVADLLTRWVALAARRIERDGWSRTSFPETETEPWSWLADLLELKSAPTAITVPSIRRLDSESPPDSTNDRMFSLRLTRLTKDST